MNFNPWIAGPILIGVGLPLFFGALLSAISFVGGWSTLAKSYRATKPAPHPRLRMQSADLRRWCGYGNCLTLSADADALYMSVMFPFGFGHPQLRLPWAEAQVKQTTHWFGIQTTEFIFENAPSIPIRLKRKTAETLIAQTRSARGASEEYDGAEIEEERTPRKN